MPRWLLVSSSILCLFIGMGAASRPDLSAAFPLVSILFLGVLFMLCTSAVLTTTGWKRGAGLLASLALFAIGFETLALQTGFPYGEFSYSGIIGARLPGGASWTIPLGWIPLVLFSFASTPNSSALWKRLVIGTGLLCLLDLVIDPVATAMGFWQWSESSWYYGVPLQNFGGWIISGLFAMGICSAWIKSPLVRFSSFQESGLLLLAFHIGAALVLHQWIPVLLGNIVFLTVLLRLVKIPIRTSNKGQD